MTHALYSQSSEPNRTYSIYMSVVLLLKTLEFDVQMCLGQFHVSSVFLPAQCLPADWLALELKGSK